MIASELDAMLAYDEHHWWYRGRRRVMRAILQRLPMPDGARLLDAGCGSGRTLDELRAFGAVSGVDLSPDAVHRARARGHADVSVSRVEALPFPDGTFDLVTCLDVIEHTPDDQATLRELLRVLTPRGRIVVSVPAHPALWSTHDEVNLHHRRYTRAALNAAASGAGLRVLSDTYFNGLLLAPVAAVRWAHRLRPPHDPRSDLAATSPRLNGLLERPLAFEARLIASGRRVPFGLSLFAVLQPVEPLARIAAPAPGVPAASATNP